MRVFSKMLRVKWHVLTLFTTFHNDVIKWKHFPHYWAFVRGIHQSPVNSPHKGQWHGAFMFSLICAWTNGWVNNRYAGGLRRQCAQYDVNVMHSITLTWSWARWLLYCLLNHLFRRRSKKTSKLRVTGLCAGNSPVTGEFPTQRASNAENVSFWWRHHGRRLNSVFDLPQAWTSSPEIIGRY